MATFTDLQKSVDDLAVQVQATKGVQASAVAAFQKFGDIVIAKVTEALTADNAADDASIAAATAAIKAAVTEVTDSTNALGAAIVANP